MNVIQSRRCCKEPRGYEVQHLTVNGWQPCSITFKEESEAELHRQKLLRPTNEFKVSQSEERRKK